MIRVCLVALMALPLLAEPPRLTPVQIADGWIQLFDGETLFGWTAMDGSQWKVEEGVLAAASGPSGWLRTDVPFADFRLVLEFEAVPHLRTGVFLRAGAEGHPWETGYEVLLDDTVPKEPAGSVLGVRKAKKSELKRGWHTLDVTARGSGLTVRVDGKVTVQARDFRSHAGSIGLRYTQGSPARFRNIRLRPLDLACLFDGQSLKGWRVVERTPKPPQPAEWSVKDGAIHVEKGPGQLETEQAWDDFILQIDVKTNTDDAKRHPNSGIFFRGDRDLFWSGYEAQIRNEYKGDNPAQAVDYGTGGIYNRQAARRIEAKDNEWFTQTIVAAGRQMGVWVNGVMVTSWEDPRPAGLNPRAGQARLLRGTLSLQAHDPTTNLDFRNVCIAPLPKI
jgi:hypothetical protein